MSSAAKKIRMTIVLDNADYFAFHKKVEELHANHTKVVRHLIREWIISACVCKQRGARQA